MIEDFVNKIFCGNSADILSKFPDECIDLVVTSPPYDNLRVSDIYFMLKWEDFEKIVMQLARVMKKGGVIVWVVGDATINGSETLTSFKQALFFKEQGKFNVHDTMIYQKSGIVYPETNRYYQGFEYMFVFSKGKPRVVNLIKDKKNKYANTYTRGVSNYRYRDGKLYTTKKRRLIKEYSVRTNIWKYAIGRDNSTRDEIAFKCPAIFPEKLAADHILSWSNEGDIVLDPFCGSGTTLKMAKILMRRFIGIDLSQKSCDISMKRIENVGNINPFVY